MLNRKGLHLQVLMVWHHRKVLHRLLAGLEPHLRRVHQLVLARQLVRQKDLYWVPIKLLQTRQSSLSGLERKYFCLE